MTTDIMEFVHARLAEVERLARAATPGPWKDGEGTVALHRNGMDEITGYVHEQADIDHIVAHDPAVVLRDVAATRGILDLHKPIQLNASVYGPDVIQCSHCAELCHSGTGLGCEEPIDAPWPCPTMRLIISRWSTHPDYQQEWAP